MKITKEQFKTLLVDSKLVPESQFNDAVSESERTGHQLEEVLVDSGVITDVHLGEMIANFLQLDYVSLSKQKIPDEVLHIVPEVVARAKGIIAFNKDKETVSVGMINPNDLEMVNFIEKRTGLKVSSYFITTNDLRSAVTRYQSSVSDTISVILSKLESSNVSKIELENSIIEMVDIILRYAYLSGTSDVHIDPFEEKAVIRFRIDGILNDIVEIPNNIMNMTVSRIKILAKMRTDEHRAAQDGKLTFDVYQQGLGTDKNIKSKVDVRVSIVPTTNRENVVMRILATTNRSITLDDLGLSKDDADKLLKAIKNPVGMILVTGPTGSGKTTTLYSLLKLLNKRDVNIATIEDPVEYTIEGITQIQVNVKTDLTFANGLRAIVRQDPNIIMVGEIRDHETADIAVNSAMTGHLVLSTLHTNDSATTLPRLLDMGIEPFLISSTVNIAVAQRLVRKICENCRASYIITAEEKKLIETQPALLDAFKKIFNKKDMYKDLRLYKGSGCNVCENTGYIGRVGIFEILSMNSEIKEAILKRASSSEIMEIARKDGMTTMIEDGLDKVIRGVTTVDEVLRVSSTQY